jgi:predicted GNAT superfamily acetyltransferase
MTDLTPGALGFLPSEQDGPAWRRELRGRTLLFRSLRHLDELEPVDDIQRETMGTSDYDLIPASELVVVPETGGHVLAVYELNGTDPGRMLAAGYAWGGFVDGRPRLVSDFLGVRREVRSLGIGEAMKRLQAAIAFQAGFEEIVWTVDPLRSANARLNFTKLGAVCRHYERNRYGESFGEAHYGGLPTDRLHLTWPIRDARVVDLLLGRTSPRSFLIENDEAAHTVMIPENIDTVLAASRDDALRWRLRVRAELESLFDDGWQIDGFAPAGAAGPHPALVLHHPA